MKLAKNLGIATIAAALSVAAIATKPTQAAIVKYNFTVNATSGDNPGKYFGSFEYDDSSLTGLGLETIAASQGLTVNFQYLGNTYTEEDDELYDIFPLIKFDNGKLLGLSYFVPDQFLIGDIDEEDLAGNIFYSIEQSVNTAQVGTVKYAKVPEPFAVGGTAIAATLGLWVKRKKKAVVAG